MSNKQKPFGEVLVEAGIIDHQQLARVLAIQKEYPQRTIGEIVSITFSIPMEIIETVFVDDVLCPAISSMLTNYLKQEMESVVDTPIALNQLIYEIDVISITLKRITLSSFEKGNGGRLQFMPESRRTATEIGGKLRLSIRTAEDISIVDPIDTYSYMYEFETGKAQVESCGMDGIRFLFRRKIREQKGEIFVFQPVRKDELEEILNLL